MSHKEGENLPSVNDFLENQEDLPSLESFKEENLPSLEEFVTTPKEEDSVTIEDANGESFLEVIDVVKAPEWQELVRLVNDVRKDIPEIPEIKYYDEELEQLGQKIREIQDNVSFFDQKSSKIGDLDSNIAEIWEKLPEIESKIPEIPEIKYYEGDIDYIYKKIDLIKEEIATLPEVKYYENDLEELKLKINDVKESIPTFPDWVNKVEEVPDFSWIGKTFSIIDDDFNKVQGHLDLIKEKIDLRVSELNETIETKDFELKVDVKNIIENHQEVKNKIFNELKETSIRVWEHHKEFKDDDRKLKKAILSEQNNLKQSLEKEIKRINQESVNTDETLLKVFTELKEEVNNLPQVKYYEKDIEGLRSELKKDVKEVREGLKDLNAELHVLRHNIKEEQKQLTEQYLLNEPPGEKETAGGQTDPLTPMDQKFATLDDLSNHYRLFINRITTQLATMGGGGAGFIKDLDDVDISGLEDGYILQYEASTSKWKTVENAGTGVGGTWFSNDVGVSTTRIVGINTTTAKTGKSLFVVGDVEFDGNLSVAGTITKHDIINLDSIGIVTARSGIHISSNGLESSGISTFNTGVGTVHIGVGNTTLLVDGDARVTGILTVGSGSITLNPNTKQVTGIDEIIVGSGASLSLAPLFTSRGTFSIDYSSLTLKGFDSQLDGTYNRQSEYFVLDTAPSASGSARFSQRSDHYYFLHESDNSKIIIYNTVDTFWVAIYSSGSNFSSPSNGQVVNPVSVSQFVTPIREDYDDSGRASPSSGFGIEYKTLVTDHTSSLGIATGTSLDISGILTASSFRGDGSQLTNIISGVGIQSESVRVGTGFTDINFTGAGITVVGSGTTVTVDIPSSTITRQTETSSGVTTDFTITGGYTVGLIDVFLNGVKQRSGVDFTASDGSTVTMTPFISDGDVVEFQKYDKLNIAGITSVTNATNAYNIVGTDFSLNTSGIITAASFVGDGTGLTGVASTDNIITGTAATFTGNVNISGVTTVGLLTAYTTIKVGTAITMDSASGIVSATSFSGDGSNLTGVISGVEIENNGTSVGTGITAINFSTNVTATASGGIATVTASGSGGGSDGPSSVMMGMIF